MLETVPERSRSRDEHMWQRPHTQQRGRSYEPRPEAPPAPRLRKVLVIVDLLGVRPLMTKVHSDVMASTTREITPSLNVMEERALFTYNVLSQYSSPWILHGVQPFVLHQSAHLVHVGSLPAPILHGHQMARWDWRHIRLSQWTSTYRPFAWVSTSLARRSGRWIFLSDWDPPI